MQVALDAIGDLENDVFVSVVAPWEMEIKRAKGRLELRAPLARILRDQRANGLEVLPVSAAHVLALEALPAVHRDPFDRMLVAQAVAEDAVLVTRDAALEGYPVATLW